MAILKKSLLTTKDTKKIHDYLDNVMLHKCSIMPLLLGVDCQNPRPCSASLAIQREQNGPMFRTNVKHDIVKLLRLHFPPEGMAAARTTARKLAEKSEG